MKVHRYAVIILSTMLIVSLALIFCTDPTKPDFNTEAQFTNDQIQSQGFPYVDSLLYLYVLAEGEEPLSFQWNRNGSELAGANDDTLTFDTICVSDSGTYTCVVWNEHAGDTSLPYFLVIYDPPAIVSHPQSISKVAGDSAMFTVSATGSLPLSYQWQKDTIDITGAAGQIYTTPLALIVDSGSTYRCIVSNSVGKDTSDAAVLSVVSNVTKPAIMTHPQSKSILAGDSTIFIVSATGTAPLGYQWQKDSVDISNSAESWYQTPAATLADSGSQYRCIVLNSAGRDTSNAAILSVTVNAVKPEIATEPQDKGVGVGGSATFTVTATGTEPLSYQWQKNGADITNATNTGYTTPAAALADSGSLYKCIVTNSVGSDTSRAAVLSVSQNVIKPDITKDPQNKDILVGDSTTFFVSATGTIPLSYQWQENGVDISSATDSSYTTPAVALADSGSLFKCIVSNSIGSDTSKAAVLTVTQNVIKPDITTEPQDKIINEGATTTFNVAASGTEPLTYQWQKNNTDIPTATSAGYTITPATMADSGSLFRCIVSNSAGSDTSRAAILSVNKVNHPPVCSDTTITENEEVQVSVNIFAADQDGDALTWTIIQGPTKGTVTVTTGSIDSTNTEFGYTADNIISSSSDAITVRIDDGANQIEMTVGITITADNDLPVIDQVPSVNAVEDITNPYSINISGHDPEGSAVKWYIDKLPSKGTLDKLEGDISAGIEMLYTLKPDFSGKDSLTFYLRDLENNSSDTQTVQITITSVNDAPVINSQSATLSCLEDNNLILQLSHLDVTDIDNPASDLTLIVNDDVNYSIVSGTTIRPDQDFNGPLTVKVKVSDGTDESGVFDMSITVTPVNDKPSITITSCPSSSPFGTIVDIVTSFSDVDNNIDSIFFLIDSQVEYKGAVSGTSYTYNWTAAFGPHVIGQHNIEVIISDDQDAKDTSQTTITITGTFISDTLTARALLDLNGLTTRPAVSTGIFYTDNRITQIDAGWGQFYVRLLEIPPEIGNISETLNYMNIHNYSDVTGVNLNLPAEIGKLTKVEYLLLNGRYMTDLPDEIVNLVNVLVDKLDLSGNKLPTDANPPEPWEQWATDRDSDWRDNQ